MEPPQTRREKKKDQKEKGQGKNGKYSSKHVRKVESLSIPKTNHLTASHSATSFPSLTFTLK